MSRFILAVVLLAAHWPGINAVHADDKLQLGLVEAAVSIRTIDGRDEEFSDLEPLIHAIGEARVVLLGEPSHGSGGAFAAKARLIRFLHQRLGFDVIAWESGLHALQATQDALDAGEDPVTAARRGIFPIWSSAEQVRPLLEYVAASRGGARPIDMAGIDSQFTAAGAVELLAADLRGFITTIGDAELREDVNALVDELFDALARLRSRPKSSADSIPITAQDRDAVTRSVDDLIARFDASTSAIGKAHSAARVAFLEQALASLRDDALNTYERRRPDRPGDASRLPLQSAEWNRRDARMAANLLWLLEQRYRGRKIIVWGHNAHIMRAYFAVDWTAVTHEAVDDGMTPMGALLAARMKDEAYAIGFTTFEGEDHWANGQKRGTIAAAPAGSLEARMHAIGKPYLFVDLRTWSRRAGGGCVGPVSMRISGLGPPVSNYGNDLVPDLSRAFDAVFFIDRMTGAIAIPGR